MICHCSGNRNFSAPSFVAGLCLVFCAIAISSNLNVSTYPSTEWNAWSILTTCDAFPFHQKQYPAIIRNQLKHRNLHYHDKSNNQRPRAVWPTTTQLVSRTSKTKLRAAPRVGLIGLPNVGKSTLFNAVSRTADLARAANFPFCTIEPNRAPIAIPDPYLRSLSNKFVAPNGTIRPARIELIDVAGLVEGASRGEGLGNQFLAVIRECKVIFHVLRYFPDGNVMRHEEGTTSAIVDPIFDAAIVNNELLLADLAHAEKRVGRIKEETLEKAALNKALLALRDSIPARFAGLTPEEEFAIKSMGLLTLKPVVYTFNVDEMDFTAKRDEVTKDIRTNIMPKIRANDNGNKSDIKSGDKNENNDDDFVLVSAKLEEDLLSLGGHEEQSEYMAELMSMGESDDNDEDSSLSLYQDLLSYKVIPSLVCNLLSLSLCYTGPGVPPERSQTTKSYLFGTSSDDGSDDNSDEGGKREASLTVFGLAGKIHGELQRGFLRAEVIRAEDLLRFESFREAKEEGCVRTEGKDYLIEEGDTVLIKWKE